MSQYRMSHRKAIGRFAFLAVMAAFVFIIPGAVICRASALDRADTIWAVELAQQIDYGIFSERYIDMPGKQRPRDITPLQTPPPDEGEFSDPKPMKPPDREGVPVDPSFVPETCTAPVINVSAATGNQAETFVVVNPTNTNNIVAFSNSSGNSIYRAYSTNGGSTWTRGTVATGAACCDGQAVWDSFGNLFLVYLNASASQANLIMSTNGGATFGAPVTVGTGPSGTVDQPSIAVGSGSVWVDWNNNGDNNGDMLARGAPVTGLGGLGAFGPLQTIPGATGTYGGIAVGPGGKVILTYMAPELTQGPATIYSNTDADGLGPGGFGARVTVTATNVGGYDYIPPQSGRSVDAEAGVVWDTTGGPFNNRIYLVYTDETVNENNDTDILLRTSDDDGATWTSPVRINDDTTTRSQFNPYIALDHSTGTVAVGFYDSRNDNGVVGSGGTNTTPNDDAEYFASYSTDGGVTWAPNVRMSGGWSNAAAAGSGVDYGDYNGQDAINGKFYAVWADNSNCEGTNPSGTLHSFDLYMGTLALPAATTPTPTSTPTNTPSDTPSATPSPTPAGTPAISGTVIYGNAIGAPTPRFVSNVTLTGSGSPNVTATTGAPGSNEGQYTLIGFGPGAYTVAPGKTGGANNITSFDAARIAQHAAGIVPLTGNQLLVADVSGNGSITSFDAAEVANYVVSAAPAGSTASWIFSPASRNYPSVTTNMTGQDYTALVMGEVSGNWNNTGARQASDAPEKGTVISAPHLITPAASEVIIPVNIDGIDDKGIISYEFDLRYDPSVIRPRPDPIGLTGTISSKLSFAANGEEKGLLRVAVYGAMPLKGNGNLLDLRFTAVGVPGSVSPLTWERIMLNEGDPRTIATDGQVELSAAAPDQAEISGRLLTTTGEGIPHARVTLTDTAGQSRSVLSNGFGVYRFGGLEAGQAYTISVGSRGYAFTPLIVSVTDQLVNVDMIAEQ